MSEMTTSQAPIKNEPPPAEVTEHKKKAPIGSLHYLNSVCLLVFIFGLIKHPSPGLFREGHFLSVIKSAHETISVRALALNVKELNLMGPVTEADLNVVTSGHSPDLL